MNTLAQLYQDFGLAILVAPDDDSARRHVAAELAALGQPLEFWSWDVKHGLQPEFTVKGTPAWTPGAFAGRLAKAVETVQEHPVCLLVLESEQYDKPGTALKAAIARQLDQEVQSWIILATNDRDLSPLLEDADIDPRRITARAESTAQPAATRARRGAAQRSLSLADLEDVEAFDTFEWTERIETLPVSELRDICNSEQYAASRTRVENLCKQLKNVFVGKDELIDLMACCAVAQLPMLLLGPWGTGKSLLVRQFSAGLGINPEHRSVNTEDELVQKMVSLSRKQKEDPSLELATEVQKILFDTLSENTRHFEYLVTRFTTPEELLGPVNVEALLSCSVHLRQTRSLMPRAEIVFLDEVFKANSAILNALLTIMNERLFHNAGVPWSVNMIMLFGASNEPPQEAELGAFYDRFPIRALCSPVANDQVHELLARSHAHQLQSLFQGRPSPNELSLVGGDLKNTRMTRLSCVNDFRLLRKVALFKFGGADIDSGGNKTFTDRYLQLFRQLRDEYDISDRSCAHFYRLARAQALLKRQDELRESDVCVLQYCGKTPEQLRELQRVLKYL